MTTYDIAMQACDRTPSGMPSIAVCTALRRQNAEGHNR
mgnify:CR=1 FL=1